MNKILSCLLFFGCLFPHSTVLAGEFSFLQPVYHLLLTDKNVPDDPDIPDLQYYTLTANISAGSGTINSSPAGISCESDCSASYPSGTLTTLTATPSASNTFIGWSGDCAGRDTCSVRMDKKKSVTAQFSSNIVEIEPNDSAGHAEDLGFDVTINGIITGPVLGSNNDWYNVTTPDARTVTVRFSASNIHGYDDLYWLIQVYKANGSSQLTEYVVMSTSGEFNVDLPTGGDYYFVVKARGVDGDAATNEDYYDLIVFSNENNSSIAPGEKEANNDKASANVLDYDTAITGSLLSRTDKDWYKVRNTTGSSITATVLFTTSSNANAWIVSVYSQPDQTMARLKVRNGSSCNIVIPASASYYFVVTDFINTTGEDDTVYNGSPYTLTVRKNSGTIMPSAELEANDTRANATPVFNMTVGFTGQSSLTDDGGKDDPSDTDYFSFYNATAGQVTFQMDNSATDPLIDFWELSVEKADGTSVAMTPAVLLVNKGDLRTTATLDADTTYYIKVNSNNSSIEYHLSVP